MDTQTKTLTMRLTEMRADNVDLKSIVAGLRLFQADLEAQGVQVSITVEDWRVTEPAIVILKTESEAVK